MTTQYHRDGAEWAPMSARKFEIKNKLPAGVYTIKQRPMNGPLYLEEVGGFTVPKKIYGSSPAKNAARILGTYADRAKLNKSTGALLVGQKGSGKTMLAMLLAVEAIKKNIPVVVVNQPWGGEQFNQFIQDIDQPCMLLFDEFEKVYADEPVGGRRTAADVGEQDVVTQHALLTLMDGVYSSPKLFVLTCNSRFRVDQHMLNRPGRLYYYLEYGGLTREMVKELAEDTLHNKARIPELIGMVGLFDSVSFDMVQAIIEECNRYNETPMEAMAVLNVRPACDAIEQYTVKLLSGKKAVQFVDCSDPETGEGTDEMRIRANPFGVVNFGYHQFITKSRHEYRTCTVSPENLVDVNAMDGVFVYKKGNVTLTLRRYRPKFSPFEKRLAT